MRKAYGVGNYSTDANEAGAWLQRRSYRPDGSTHGLMWGHGHTSIAHAALVLVYDQLMLGDLCHEVARKGRPVFMGDFQDNSWANNACVGTMGEGWSWMKNQLGVADDGLYLGGGSMGMLSACAFAHWVRGGYTIPGLTPPDIEIKAIAGVVPATDYEDVRARNYAGYAAEIVAAYGGWAGYNAGRPDHNPIEIATELADIPIAMWYSQDDPAALPANVELFAETHGNSELYQLGNIGHSYEGMNFQEIVDFFNAH